jgi:hypothetical protein
LPGANIIVLDVFSNELSVGAVLTPITCGMFDGKPFCGSSSDGAAATTTTPT